MSILAIIQLSLGALTSVLTALGKSGAPQEIVSEVEAAVASLTNVQTKITTLAELEALRTTNLW